MQDNILDFIDFEKISELLEEFYRLTGIGIGILDLQGHILSTSSWNAICRDFHRANPETQKRCLQSDTVLGSQVKAGEKIHSYECLNGLVDVAVPIYINNEHVLSLYAGQFFYKKPDRDFFIKQAEQFGFDQKQYLKAVEQAPIISYDQVLHVMELLRNLTLQISELTRQKMEQIKLNNKLRNKDSQLQAVNQQLRAANQQLSANEQQLRAANQQLSANEQQLRAANQQLSANEQQLRAANQQLSANEQQLRAANQQLVANEKQLAENEKKFKNLVENMEDMVFRYELLPEPGFSYVSPNSTRFVGYSPQEHYDDPYLGMKIIHPDDLHILQEYMQSDIDAKKRVVFRWIAKDGNVMWTEQRNTPIYNDDGELVALEGISRDITDQVVAEQKLKQSEERLKVAVEGAEVGTWEWNIKTDQVYTNDFWIQSQGFQSNEVGTQIEWWRQLVHPDDHEISEKRMREHLEGLTSIYQIEFRVKNKAGQYHWIQDKAKVIERDDKGSPIRISGIHQDISVRKEHEQKIIDQNAEYQLLNRELSRINKELQSASKTALASQAQFQSYIENAPDGVFIVNEHGKYVDVNPAASQITGYSKDELLTMHIPDLLLKSDLQKGIEHFSRVKENGRATDEIGFVRKNGEPGYWQVAAVKLSETRFLGFVKDITQRKKAEEETKIREMHLRSLLENPAGYVIYRTRFDRQDGQIKVIEVSPSFTELLGMSEHDKYDFEKWFTYVHPDDLPKLLQANQQGMAPPFTLHVELRYNHPIDGLKWYDLRARGIPYPDDPNLIEYANGIILDITKRKNAEKLLKEKINDMRRLNRAMTGREDRIIELKQLVNELSRKCGEEPPFRLDFMGEHVK